MLLQFIFKNFKSFRDDTYLDLTATKMTELSNHVVSIVNEKVLPVAAIYGANASGKSNVREAFEFMSSYVLNSLDFGGESKGKREERRFFAPTPFLLEKRSQEAPSEFEVYFTDESTSVEKIYNYGFSVDQLGVVEEWLNYKTKSARKQQKVVFYRNRNGEMDLSGINERQAENIRVSLEKETLIVSLGAKLRIPKLKVIREWFWNNEVADFGHPMENYFLSRQLPRNFELEETQRDVIKYFSAFDESIVGFNVEKDKREDGSTKFSIDAIHKMNDSEDTVTIPLSMESAGTLKMFALYPMLHDVIKSGGVLFVDELNARLHPLLVRTFVITFLDPDININHAQLIFTTHDSWQLNSNLLRRDEVWFTEKGKDGASTLYSLADFCEEDGTKIRKDENFEKNYLLGKYGAIPKMKNINVRKGE